MSDNFIDIEKAEGSSMSANRIDWESKTILIYDDIDIFLARDISTYLPQLDKLKGDITIKFNTVGGDIYATQSIISEILKCESTVKGDIVGVAFSGGSMVALACDELKISELGEVMLHYPNWETDNKSLKEHKQDLKVTQEYFERTMKSLLTRTKLSWAEWKKMVSGPDVFLKPKECLKLGVVDYVY